jgi:hypothetical protein
MKPTAFLYSTEPEQLRSALADSARLRPFESVNRLNTALAQGNDQLLIVDLYSAQATGALTRWSRKFPGLIIIAVGEPRTDPFLAAERLDLYAVEDATDITLICRSIRHAGEMLTLREENRRLKAAENQQLALPRTESIPLGVSACLQHFMRIFGERSGEAVRDHLVAGIASAMRVSRVVLYELDPLSGGFRYSAGRQALATNADVVFDLEDSFSLWLELSSRVVGNSTLYHLPLRERDIVASALDLVGAVALAPLQVEGNVAGCLFVGHRAGSAPLDIADLETLSNVAEFVSSVQAQQRAQDHTNAQREIFNALANALSLGLLVVGSDESVYFVNDIARDCLGLPANSARSLSMDLLDSRLAHGLRMALEGTCEPVAITTVNGNKHDWNVDFLPFGDAGGAAALLQDASSTLPVIAQPSSAARGLLPHHVRNQLVAINTFAQLLPEQYEDAAFREEFQELVTGEVARILEFVDRASNATEAP